MLLKLILCQHIYKYIYRSYFNLFDRRVLFCVACCLYIRHSLQCYWTEDALNLLSFLLHPSFNLSSFLISLNICLLFYSYLFSVYFYFFHLSYFILSLSSHALSPFSVNSFLSLYIIIPLFFVSYFQIYASSFISLYNLIYFIPVFVLFMLPSIFIVTFETPGFSFLLYWNAISWPGPAGPDQVWQRTWQGYCGNVRWFIVNVSTVSHLCCVPEWPRDGAVHNSADWQ